MRNLLELWTQVIEQLEIKGPAYEGPLVRAKFKTARVAYDKRLELYRYRKKVRQQSRKGLDPSDPNYDTSPWDLIKIVQVRDEKTKEPTGTLEFFNIGMGAEDFEIEIPDEIVQAAPKRGRHRKPAD